MTSKHTVTVVDQGVSFDVLVQHVPEEEGTRVCPWSPETFDALGISVAGAELSRLLDPFVATDLQRRAITQLKAKLAEDARVAAESRRVVKLSAYRTSWKPHPHGHAPQPTLPGAA